MILKKISINNFKSIYGDFELVFQDIKGFWKIEGPVGAGKTTIGEAILFGLFGDIKGKNIGDLISWGEKKGSVDIECYSKGHDISIHRVIGGDISITIDNEPLIYTNKRDAQLKLENEYYDISRLTLELLCIISFNNFRSLSNMSPSDTRVFLDKVFGFSLLTSYSELCKDNKRLVENDLHERIGESNSLVAQIQKIKEIAGSANIKGDPANIKSTLTELRKELKEVEASEQEALSPIREELAQKQESLAHVKALGTNKANEIKFIEQGICPTCGAPIDQSQLEIKKQEREAFLKQYADINARIKELKAASQNVLSEYAGKKEQINARIRENSILLVKIEEQERRDNIGIEEIKSLKKKHASMQEEISALRKDISEWEQLNEFLSSDMRRKIISSFLPMLNRYILEYSRELNLPYIISFDDSFRCSLKVFNMDNHISISSLSTGQLKTVDMCIILGVLKIIFSGLHFNVMFLDELLSNMDLELRTKICNMLKKELKPDTTLFLISHQEYSDSDFDGSITAQLYFDDNMEKSRYNIVKKI